MTVYTYGCQEYSKNHHGRRTWPGAKKNSLAKKYNVYIYKLEWQIKAWIKNTQFGIAIYYIRGENKVT